MKRRAANDGGVNRIALALASGVGLAALASAGCVTGASSRHSPEAKAVRFLAREVPAWSRENRCFSCHNNGDAARALLAAARLGFHVPRQSLADTVAWVSKPAKWDDNKGDPAFSDKRLANIQFAATLVVAFQAGQARDIEPLRVAARRVAADQAADGSWPVHPPGTVGSPATHGTALATHFALKSLHQAGLVGLIPAIQRGEQWLRASPVHSVPDAAAVLLALKDATDAPAASQRERALTVLRRAQSSDGGWGPYPDTPPEPFDTALALLALADASETPGATAMIRRGRSFLIASQKSDGSWQETTRPPKGESYAQRISTTGWATQALMATRGMTQ